MTIWPSTANSSSYGLTIAVLQRSFCGAADQYGVTEATWLRDGEAVVVVYRAPKSKFQHLWRIDLPEMSFKQLTTGDRFDFSARRSPVSNSLIFISHGFLNGGKRGGRYVHWMNPDGTGLRKLTTLDEIQWSPAWSADGSRIAFVGEYSIFVANVDDNTVQKVVDSQMRCFFPRFVGVSNEIVFWSAGSFGHASPIATSTYHDFTPHIVDLDSKTVNDLPIGGWEYNLRDSDVSSDGRYLMWHLSELNSGGVRIMLLQDGFKKETLEPEGELYRHKLSEGPSTIKPMRFPQFTEDDRVLFGMSSRSATTQKRSVEVHLMRLQTRETHQLTHLGQLIVAARLSRDGEKLLMIVDPNPGNRVTLLQLWILDVAQGSVIARFDATQFETQTIE